MLILAILLFLTSCTPKKREEVSFSLPPPPVVFEKRVVMIDPGHGGEDFGTHSETPPRYEEKCVNLATACYLKNFLEQKKFKVLMTRTSDTFVTLEARSKKANEEKPDIYVSIHYNSAPSAKAEGVEVFYFKTKVDEKRTASSKFLGERVLSQILQKTDAKSRGVKHGDFSVIRETKMPAILVEGGFLTNPQEMEKLKETAYLKKIANGIAEGILEYFKECS
jgi:N-acetylmuramoyl-L-alanine amidase